MQPLQLAENCTLLTRVIVKLGKDDGNNISVLNQMALTNGWQSKRSFRTQNVACTEQGTEQRQRQLQEIHCTPLPELQGPSGVLSGVRGPKDGDSSSNPGRTKVCYDRAKTAAPTAVQSWAQVPGSRNPLCFEHQHLQGAIHTMRQPPTSKAFAPFLNKLNSPDSRGGSCVAWEGALAESIFSLSCSRKSSLSVWMMVASREHQCRAKRRQPWRKQREKQIETVLRAKAAMGHGGGDTRLHGETMQQDRMTDEEKKGYKSRAD